MALLLEDKLEIEEIEVRGYEKVYKITHSEAGLHAIICLHNLTLGPGLGGTRIYPYRDWQAALKDGLRLAKGMTYKAALADVGLGGAKSVIIADPKTEKTPELLLAFGRAVDRLQGQYICAEDSGSTTDDMMIISQTTSHVVGLPHTKSSGNPSPFTAWGTYRGMQAVLQVIYGSGSVKGRRIAIQGVGSVGAFLADMLFWRGAKLIVCDVDRDKAAAVAGRYGGVLVAPEDIFAVDCDIFSPCAMGGAINAETIPLLSTKAIAGCANNQLGEDRDVEELKERNILYAPDFVINAGGLINVAQEIEKGGYDPMRAQQKVDQIYDQLIQIFAVAKSTKSSTHAAAVALGDHRLKYGICKRTTAPHMHHAST